MRHNLATFLFDSLDLQIFIGSLDLPTATGNECRMFHLTVLSLFYYPRERERGLQPIPLGPTPAFLGLPYRGLRDLEDGLKGSRTIFSPLTLRSQIHTRGISKISTQLFSILWFLLPFFLPPRHLFQRNLVFLPWYYKNFMPKPPSPGSEFPLALWRSKKYGVYR